MSPEECMELGRLLREESHQQGHSDFIDRDHDGQDDRFQDPDYLANVTSRRHREQPDLLGSASLVVRLAAGAEASWAV